MDGAWSAKAKVSLIVLLLLQQLLDWLLLQLLDWLLLQLLDMLQLLLSVHGGSCSCVACSKHSSTALSPSSGHASPASVAWMAASSTWMRSTFGSITSPQNLVETS